MGPPAWSWPSPHEEVSPPGYLVRVASGLVWRFTLVGAVALGILVSPAVPLAAAVGVLLGSQLISLRRGPSAAAPLWRTGLIALALAVSSGLGAYPKLVAGGLLWVGVEPWVLAGAPWRPRFGRLHSRILSRLRELDEPAWSTSGFLQPPAEEGRR
ncbi:MAG: hypothetical protein WCB85_11340 [Candidatus Dormiibacterota bacterium]